MSAAFDDDELQEGLGTGLLGIRPGVRVPQGLGSTLLQAPPQGPVPAPIQPAFDVDKAAAYLDKTATPHYIDGVNGNCARNVREAIQAGGRKVTNTDYAKDYGPNLVAAGYTKLEGDALKNYTHKKGDVIIYPAWQKHTSGHMEMYDGKQWVSDFKQKGPVPFGDGTLPYDIYRP